MALWIVFAVLTAVTILAVAAPLMKGGAASGGGASGGASASDEEVYRSQLEELEAERSQGLLGEAEYAAARVEISRRLLQAAKDQPGPDPAPAPGASYAARAFAYIMVAALPAGALTLYLHYGSPDLPGRPLKERLAGPIESQPVDALVLQVEQRLREHPKDGVGWSVVAPVYLKMGRYEDAANAYDRAIGLLGESASLLIGRGQALVFAAQGAVTAEARAAFSRAAELDPQAHIASFWLAIGFEQLGQWDKAAAAYRELLQKNPQDGVRETAAARLKAAEEQAGRMASGGAPAMAAAPSQSAGRDRGPTAADVKAAMRMSASDRAAMINQMTDRLAARLDKNGNDLSGWLKLMRAYSVLGRKDDALKALSAARKNFAGDAQALGQIDALARSLGLAAS
jgi:cytochrome c-type biogenesis protein CcmH